MTYPSTWFDSAGIAIQDPPRECVKDCSRPGIVDEDVDYWVQELDLTAPPWLLRRYLKGFGAWSAAELCDHTENLKRLLWIWCCNIREAVDSGMSYYLMALE